MGHGNGRLTIVTGSAAHGPRADTQYRLRRVLPRHLAARRQGIARLSKGRRSGIEWGASGDGGLICGVGGRSVGP